MSASAPPRKGERLGTFWISAAIAFALLAALVFLPCLGEPRGAVLGQAAGGASGNKVPPFPAGPTGPVWGKNVDVTVPFQKTIEMLPPGAPYVFRVTELEMSPGARIFDHKQLGVGAHYVLRGNITIENAEDGASTTYGIGQGYFEGLEPLHRAVNGGADENRVLMFDLLSASRGFDGQQQFTSTGRHNEGELRSGPYVQIPLADLPQGPLMLRITDMKFGPKAKTVEHVHVGPAIYFVQEGTATVRKNWNNSSITYGTNGYFYESGREPYILENKPAAPARFVAVEILPASLGDAPSTIATED
ncbi:MAG: hypothetical protein IT305_16250 [Chloroflexi bacterium]|nr:hypothetical protein [Chloroflexota bacterium]